MNWQNKILKISSFIVVIVLGLWISSYLTVHQEVQAEKHRVTCSQFKTQQEAQNYYDTKQKGFYSLYVGKLGEVCVRLARQ